MYMHIYVYIYIYIYIYVCIKPTMHESEDVQRSWSRWSWIHRTYILSFLSCPETRKPVPNKCRSRTVSSDISLT